MAAQVSADGRLMTNPQTRTTEKGTTMTMARLAVSLPSDTPEFGQPTFWLSVLAFGKQAEALARSRKGDPVKVTGSMRANHWMGPDGDTLQGYQVLAETVISPQ